MTSLLRTKPAANNLARYYSDEFEAAATGSGTIIVDQLLDSVLFCDRRGCSCGNVAFLSESDISAIRDNPHPDMARCQVELRVKLTGEKPKGCNHSSLTAAYEELNSRMYGLEGAKTPLSDRQMRRIEQIYGFLRPPWAKPFSERDLVQAA